MKTITKVVAGLAILSTAMSACSSSNATSSGGSNSGGKNNDFKIGVLTDLTGPYSSAFLTSEQGVKATVVSRSTVWVVRWSGALGPCR
jgi:hypothetical protein